MMNFSLITQRVKEGASIVNSVPGMLAFIAKQTDDRVLKECRAQAKAVLTYLATHGKDRSVEEYNAAAKVLAKSEHRLGEVLAVTVNHQGGRPKKNSDIVSEFQSGKIPAGIHPRQSSRAQLRAKIEWPKISDGIDLATEQNERVKLSRLLDQLVMELKLRDRQAKAKAGAEIESDLIVTGDFNDVLPTLPDESVDLIFTDPPYDKESIALYGQLAEHAARILKPGGSLFAYVGHYAIDEVITQMKTQLRFWWPCAVKHSVAAARLPGFAVFVHWKPLVWFVKGMRRDKGMVADFVESEFEGKSDHDWQQGTKEAAYYIQRLTVEGEMVLDPMCGAGTTCLAALKLGRRCLGIEIVADRAAVAKTRIHQLRAWVEMGCPDFETQLQNGRGENGNK
jgi:16S rRNA G966 N2-methylase RsmD